MPSLLAGRRERLLLVALVALVSAPHIVHLPLWASGLAVCVLAWQTWAHAAGRAPPPPGLRVGLTLLLFAGVALGFGRIDGAMPGVTLLVLMLALKLCEMARSRDAMVVLALCCVVLVAQFIFSQSPIMAAALVLQAWAIVAAFVYLHTRRAAGRARHAAGESATLLGLALPVAVALFLLFPRLPGPLWGLPSDTGSQGITGLSDHMAPGAISQLARSDALAFRARFDGAVPPPAARYWRGPVFWDLDDGNWHNRRSAPSAGPSQISAIGPTQQVAITLEPSHQRWLIALDMPLSSTHAHRRTHGDNLVSPDPIETRIRYIETSATRYRLGRHLVPATRRRALALPASGNPRTRALARRWAAQDSAASAIVHRALQRFHDQPYRYTLDVPRTSPGNGIDDFLFDTRAGFCEHYAGAFVFLMRAAGVPARVVTGYLGGRPGLGGNYWIVRQADAHAWAEVWYPQQGWQRVDPTAAVAPERIERGIAQSLAEPGDLGFMARGQRGNPWYEAGLVWDALDAGWNQWFLAYGPALQDRLFRNLGLSGMGSALGLLTALVVGLMMIASALMAWRMRRPGPDDPVTAAWQRIDRRLARLDLARRPGETVHHQARRVADTRPDLAEPIQDLAARYARLRFGAHSTPAERRVFLARARAFRARPRSNRPMQR